MLILQNNFLSLITVCLILTNLFLKPSEHTFLWLRRLLLSSLYIILLLIQLLFLRFEFGCKLTYKAFIWVRLLFVSFIRMHWYSIRWQRLLILYFVYHLRIILFSIFWDFISNRFLLLSRLWFRWLQSSTFWRYFFLILIILSLSDLLFRLTRIFSLFRRFI